MLKWCWKCFWTADEHVRRAKISS